MKINFDSKPKKADYDSGLVRTKKKFLLFPKIIRKEMRWLETAEWVEYIDYNLYFYDGGGVSRKYFWRPLCWLDKITEKDVAEGGLLHNPTLLESEVD